MNFLKLLVMYLFFTNTFITAVDEDVFFRHLLTKTESALTNELDKKINLHPNIDIILITARNECEKKFYEEVLDKQYAHLFRDDVQIKVIADAEGKGGFIGSTGGLLCALAEIQNSYQWTSVNGKDFKDLRIAVIKAGGMARRMIAAYAYANKCQMPIPLNRSDDILASTLYFAILNSYFFGQKMATMGFSGLIILCSDQLFLSDCEIKEGINYFVDPVSAVEAKRSELIVEDSTSREIVDFKRKPSPEVREQLMHKEILQDKRVWSELTNNYIIAGKSAEFLAMYANYLEGASQINDLIKLADRGYEIFTSDCILPFFMNKDDYIALRLAEYQTPHAQLSDTPEKRMLFYTKLYEIVRKSLNKSIYLCGNEEDTYCEELVDTIRFYKNGLSAYSKVAQIYNLQNRFQSKIGIESNIGADCCIYQSFVADGAIISDKCVILDSKIGASSYIGEDSIIINVTGNVTLGSKRVLARVPIILEDKQAYVLILVGIDDNPKHENKSATIFGKSLQAWLNNKNIEINGDTLSLFTVPIFPVVFEDDINMDYVAWMITKDELPSEIYKNTKHFSLQEIIKLINYAAIAK
ncbi:MAG: hypothetical protein UV38_C0002G0183 [candidate division TM6 bacterium GW2011_GWE2_42_60]|nr:MAG: hypothetical protein UV38_C0002G0183 [candidate division TM6 bacterium GW2011_GWE2_42_60]